MRVMLMALTALALGACARAPAYEVAEKSIAQLQADLGSGAVTSVQLVEAYLTRIAEIDDAGPTLNAVIVTNPEALAQARALDAERAAGRVRGPLHGIPILLKDNIETADPMRDDRGLTGAGRQHHRPRRATSWRGCARRAPLSWAKPISPNGPISAPPLPPAAGAPSAA